MNAATGVLISQGVIATSLSPLKAHDVARTRSTSLWNPTIAIASDSQLSTQMCSSPERNILEVFRKAAWSSLPMLVPSQAILGVTPPLPRASNFLSDFQTFSELLDSFCGVPEMTFPRLEQLGRTQQYLHFLKTDGGSWPLSLGLHCGAGAAL